MVADLENNIVAGLVLVVAVLLVFMGWRASLIVALAIPLSMLMSFAIIQTLGYTLNMIVLFSLVLARGHAGGQRHRHRREHLPPHAAGLRPRSRRP